MCEGGGPNQFKREKMNLQNLITKDELKINWLTVSMRIRGDSHNLSINMSWRGQIQGPRGTLSKHMWVPSPPACPCARDWSHGGPYTNTEASFANPGTSSKQRGVNEKAPVVCEALPGEVDRQEEGQGVQPSSSRP